MDIISVIMIGMATNLDNLIVGAGFGARKKKIPVWFNLLISVISAIIALAFAAFSGICGFMGGFADIFGSLLLIFLGVWGFVTEYFKRKNAGVNDGQADCNMSPKEIIALSVALAVNCVPTSFGAAMTGLNCCAISASVGLFSFLFIGIGVRIGCKISNLASSKALAAVSSVILILLGVAQLI